MDKRNIFLYLLLVVALLNVYVWWKLQAAYLPPSPRNALLLLAVILLFMAIPVLQRLPVLRVLLPEKAIQLSWLWFICSFWMLFLFGGMELWNLLGHLLARFTSWRLPLLSARMQGHLALSAVGILLLCSYWEAHRCRRKILTWETPLLTKPLCIVLLSDLHLGPASSGRHLQRIIRCVQDMQPDILLSCGDLIDGHGPEIERQARMLSEISCSTGEKWAVFGNHDCYSGLDYSRRMHEMAGFRMLEDNSALLEGNLFLYGATDAGHAPTAPVQLPKPPEGHYSIFLCHQPYLPGNPQNMHLQLSGHTHGGQIFPFQLFLPIRFPQKAGILHAVSSQARLYISPGTGSWGVPLRLFAPPEITVIRLLPPSVK